MAETTRERTDRMTEQSFQKAESAFSNVFDSSRHTLMVMMEFNRNNLRTSYEFARQVQEESLRLTDAWFDHMSQFQKSYLKSLQNYSHQVQDMTEKTAKETNDRLEDVIDQSMEMVTPISATPRTAKRR